MRVPASVGRGPVFLATLLVGVVFSAGAQAADGDLDRTFSSDGKLTTDFVGYSWARATVGQPDGKIVAVGQDFGQDAGDDFALARYNPNGSLDPSFSGDGKQKTSFVWRDDAATGVALQPNGKIVVVGTADYSTTGTNIAVARYNPDGSLDPTFSGDGKQRTSFGGRYAEAHGVALQADGKIVVVGRTCIIEPTGECSAFNFALARYNPNGTLDATFSGDGKQTTDFGGYGDGAHAVVLQDDGKIVAVGEGDDGDGIEFALARYNPNGSLDPSFSGDGRQLTGGALFLAVAVTLQGDGKIVAVGIGAAGGAFALARYNPNGSLDPSFSGDGTQTTSFGRFAAARATGVVLQGNGKIVAVGSGAGDFALARYNPNGTLDPSFSVDGKQTTDFGGEDGAFGVVLQGAKVVAVGSAAFSHFALARYKVGPGWGGWVTNRATGCRARVQDPYLDANEQVTAYTKVSCPKETRLTIRSRLRADYPGFTDKTVAQQGCLGGSGCVRTLPKGTTYFRLSCPKSQARRNNQPYYSDIVFYPGTSSGAATRARSGDRSLSPFCAY